MIRTIMTILSDRTIDYLFPLGGGSIASIITGFITLGDVARVFVFACVGAIVGWFIKLGLDYCKRRFTKKKEK